MGVELGEWMAFAGGAARLEDPEGCGSHGLSGRCALSLIVLCRIARRIRGTDPAFVLRSGGFQVFVRRT
jgi:hypothetical protein